MNTEFVTALLGWCTVINIGFLVLAILMLSFMNDIVGGITARVFGVSRAEAKAGIYNVVQQYRLAIIFFNLVPYIALKIMAAA
jgi:hypothetical protein